ncbi:MAG: methyltransferase domain-containing protein [Spirochaetes bacterium]|nr:methyltransferase domain-containing protein [Spirochaetota bacterium]
MDKKLKLLKDGDSILELGTGWIHWEALKINLFYDVKTVLYDVWDNRQFDAFKHYCFLLSNIFDEEFNLKKEQLNRAHYVLNVIQSSKNFEEIYEKLGWTYLVESSGTLNNLLENSFNIVTSGGVFEHIDKTILEEYIKDIYRILKTGGYSMQSINIGDHLYAYDRKVSKKQYLKYSDKVWKLIFNNKVQYFNRVQKSEWLKLFKLADFKLINDDSVFTNMNSLKINKKYKTLDKSDIECTILRIIHQK